MKLSPLAPPLIALMLGLSACGDSSDPPAPTDTGATGSLEIPPSFAGQTNPLPPGDTTQSALGKGRYDQLCASCHGATGRGTLEGASAVSLVAPPVSTFADDLTLFRIRVGIPSRGMPAFGSGVLDDTAVWQLILYLRTLQSAG